MVKLCFSLLQEVIMQVSCVVLYLSCLEQLLFLACTTMLKVVVELHDWISSVILFALDVGGILPVSARRSRLDVRLFAEEEAIGLRPETIIIRDLCHPLQRQSS